MTFDEIVDHAKCKNDDDMSAIEKRAYVGLRFLLDDFKNGNRTQEEVVFMKDVLRVEYEEAVKLHDDAFEVYKRGQQALTKSNTTIKGIIKAVNSGDRDYKRLFLEALSAYSEITGEHITEKVIRKKIEEE